MRTAEPIKSILERLRDRHGEPVRSASGDPVGGLVATILSQNTSDQNSNRAYEELKSAFPSWRAVAGADAGEIADAIRIGGLADQKALTIQRALRAIAEESETFDPGFLDELDDEQAMTWLQNIRGVGKKTAACVLMFDLERDVLPVDTHVHRVSRRLGLAPPSTSAELTETFLEEQIAPHDRYAAHVLMISHGRATCRARNPKCSECVLLNLCPFPEKNLDIR